MKPIIIILYMMKAYQCFILLLKTITDRPHPDLGRFVRNVLRTETKKKLTRNTIKKRILFYILKDLIQKQIKEIVLLRYQQQAKEYTWKRTCDFRTFRILRIDFPSQQ